MDPATIAALATAGAALAKLLADLAEKPTADHAAAIADARGRIADLDAQLAALAAQAQADDAQLAADALAAKARLEPQSVAPPAPQHDAAPVVAVPSPKETP